MLAREVLDAVHETIRKHKVSYDEYNALKAWLIQVGQDGEWPLFLEVWVEHVVEDVATAHRHGNKGTIEGPTTCRTLPTSAPTGQHCPCATANRAGTPMVWRGTITSTDGHPVRLAARRLAQTAGQQFVGGGGSAPGHRSGSRLTDKPVRGGARGGHGPQLGRGGQGRITHAVE